MKYDITIIIIIVALIGPPHSFTAIATGTTINIHWEAPFDPYSVILSYVVSYYLMSTSFNIETPRPRVTIADIRNTSCLISSLLVSSTYHVEVFAVTEEESNGPISEPLLITTSSPGILFTKQTIKLIFCRNDVT